MCDIFTYIGLITLNTTSRVALLPSVRFRDITSLAIPQQQPIEIKNTALKTYPAKAQSGYFIENDMINPNGPFNTNQALDPSNLNNTIGAPSTKKVY
jgi:hypothetical protein